MLRARGLSLTLAAGPERKRPYTRGMRRWVCIITLLVGFSADSYAWSARPRNPVPVERVLSSDVPGDDLPAPRWWRLS
jgi:hypothetical protein